MRTILIKNVSLLVVCIVFFACSERIAPAVPENPQRIISLRPNLTELLFAMGAGSKVVGVTTYCLWPEQAKQLPKVGSYLFPDLETIMALQPDLIITNEESNSPRLVRSMEQTGIPVLVLETRNVESIYSTLDQLGELLNLQDAAHKLDAAIKAGFDKIHSQTASFEPKSVLMVIQRRPLIVAGRTSFFHELLEKAGGSNAVALVHTAYPQISMEEVLAWQPDVIIDIDPTSSIDSWSSFPSIPAVQQKQIYLLSPDLFRPGPRIAEAADTIAHTLYPELK